MDIRMYDLVQSLNTVLRLLQWVIYEPERNPMWLIKASTEKIMFKTWCTEPKMKINEMINLTMFNEKTWFSIADDQYLRYGDS